MANTRLPSSPGPDNADDINSRTSDCESALSQAPFPMTMFTSSLNAATEPQSHRATEIEERRERLMWRLNHILPLSLFPSFPLSFRLSISISLWLCDSVAKPHHTRKTL